MPASYELDSARRLVMCRCWEVLTSEAIVEHYEALRSDPAFDPTFSQLGDLRDVTTFEIEAQVLKSEALLRTFASTARRALVASSDAAYGLSRMYASYAEFAGQNIQVFRTKEDAEKWLGLRETPVDDARTLGATADQRALTT